MRFKKLAVALSVSAALGLGTAGQANATAMANALIDISNFTLTNGAGTALNFAEFSQVSFQDTLSNVAILNPGGADFHFAIANTFSAGTDALMACVPGGGCGGQNNFSPSLVPPTATFARSDSVLTNVPISGTPFAVGVRAATIAETSLNNVTASGSSTSDIILTSTFQFVLTHGIGAAGIEFDAAAFLRAWTAAGSAPGTSAGAGYKWEVVLTDGVTGAVLLDWVPNGVVGSGTETGLLVSAEDCNLVANASATFNQPSAPTENCSGSFSAVTTFALLANHPYSFTINQHVSTQAQEVERVVAEPGALALLGIGLAGLGFMRRRWS